MTDGGTHPHIAQVLRSPWSYHKLSTLLLDLDQLARRGFHEGLRLHPLGTVLLPIGGEQLPQVINLPLQKCALVLHPENTLYTHSINPHITGQVQNQAALGNIQLLVEKTVGSSATILSLYTDLHCLTGALYRFGVTPATGYAPGPRIYSRENAR